MKISDQNIIEYKNLIRYLREKLKLSALDESFYSGHIEEIIREEMNGSPEESLINIAAKFGLKGIRYETESRNLRKICNNIECLYIYNQKAGDFNGWIRISKKNLFSYEIKSFSESGKKGLLKSSELNKIINPESKFICLSFEKYNPLPLEKKQKPLKRLFEMFKTDKNDLIVLIIYSIAIGLFSLIIPVSVQSLVNTLAFGVLIQPLVILTLIVMITLSFSSLMRVMRYYIVEIIQQRIYAKVSLTFSYRLSIIKHNAFNKAYIPELVNRFFDVVTVQKSASVLLIDGLEISLQTIIGLLLVSFYHPLLLAFDIFLIISIIFVLFVLGHGAIKSSINESKVKYETAAWLEEIARNSTSFRSDTSFVFASDKTNMIIKKYIKYRKKHFKILLRQKIGTLSIQVFAISLLLGMGGWLVIKGELSLGQLVASEIIIASIVSNLIKFGKHLEVYYDLIAAIDKLGYLIDLPIEEHFTLNKVKINPENGIRLNLKKLSHSFENSKILNNIDLEIKPGESIAITGDDGSGKSTIADILYGLKDLKSGFAEINGVDIREINSGDLRKHISIVRNIEFFDGSLEENIRLGNYKNSKLDLINILKEMKIYSKVMNLPEGLQTYIHPGQNIFSESQSFLIMFSRALFNDPKMILIDEALDKLSLENAGNILKYLNNKGITALVLTKNLEIANSCSDSISLSEGKIIRD